MNFLTLPSSTARSSTIRSGCARPATRRASVSSGETPSRPWDGSGLPPSSRVTWTPGMNTGRHSAITTATAPTRRPALASVGGPQILKIAGLPWKIPRF